MYLKCFGNLSNKFSKIAKRTPVFIVANGPSLDSDIEWLLANQGKAIIVSAGTAISALKAYGLKPDIHCEMERVMNTCNVLRSYYDEDYFKDIAFVGLNTVQPGIFELFNNPLSYKLKYSNELSNLYRKNKNSVQNELDCWSNWCRDILMIQSDQDNKILYSL